MLLRLGQEKPCSFLLVLLGCSLNLPVRCPTTLSETFRVLGENKWMTWILPANTRPEATGDPGAAGKERAVFVLLIWPVDGIPSRSAEAHCTLSKPKWEGGGMRWFFAWQMIETRCLINTCCAIWLNPGPGSNTGGGARLRGKGHLKHHRSPLWPITGHGIQMWALFLRHLSQRLTSWRAGASLLTLCEGASWRFWLGFVCLVLVT